MKNNLAIKLLLPVLFGFYFCGDARSKISTPNDFLNYTAIDKENYSRDSINILKALNVYLTNHEGFFYSKEYFDSTILFIDTIVYSKDFNKLAAFVITKNPTYRQLMPEIKYHFYYNATSYLGLKHNDTIYLKWLGPNFSNFYDMGNISSTMRESYFTEFAVADTTKSDLYKYNMNDVRFWDMPLWDSLFRK